MPQNAPIPAIPGYALLRQVSVGGMGTVFAARQVESGRDVAIKLLSTEHLGDAEMRARFQRESEILATVNDPNIVTLFDVGEYCGQPFLVMECLEGETAAE